MIHALYASDLAELIGTYGIQSELGLFYCIIRNYINFSD